MSDAKATSSFESKEYHIDPHPQKDFIASSHGICRVVTSDTHVQLGDMTFDRNDFMRAFEGSLNPGLAPQPTRKFANPVPLGVSAFCLSLFVVSLVNLETRGTSNAQAAFGLLLFYSGLIELLAGMWCIAMENAWGGTLITAFSGFWLSYGLVMIDAFGIVSSYGEDTSQFYNVMGFYMVGWTIFAFIMFLMTFRSTWVLFGLMFFVVITFILLAAAQFTAASGLLKTVSNLSKGAGVFGLLASFFGWYIVYEGLANNENALFVPPVLLMPTSIIGVKKKSDELKS